MILLIAGGAGVLIVIGFAVFLRAEDRRDDRLLRRRNPFPEPDHPGFADIPRFAEIAHEPPTIHELPPLGDAVWHPRPMTSPAATTAPPVCPGTGAGPGTAAAAAATPAAPPAAAPPPLPEGALWAPADTGFAKWESDTYVGGLTAIKDGAP